jgi:hypothetical protein
MDLFVVPSITFEVLYVFIIVRLARRDLACINVTLGPTAEWITHQITDAFLWNEASRDLIRDRDQSTVYGTAVTRRLRTMRIRDKSIAPRAQSVVNVLTTSSSSMGRTSVAFCLVIFVIIIGAERIYH